MSFTGIISSANGSQGRTTIGPKEVDRTSPSGHGDAIAIKEIELQLDGDVVTDHVVDFDDETLFALTRGALVLEASVFSDTGVAALNVGFIDSDGNGADTNVLAAQAVAGVNWAVVRDIDLAIGRDSQIAFSGLAAGERATVLIRYQEATYLASEGGVLKKHRAV